MVTSEEAKGGRKSALIEREESDGEDELGDAEFDEEDISGGKVRLPRRARS